MAQSIKKNQRSLYYIWPTDFRCVDLFYSLKVLVLHRFTALSDLIFDGFAGLFGYNDRVLITESECIPYTSEHAHNEGLDT